MHDLHGKREVGMDLLVGRRKTPGEEKGKSCCIRIPCGGGTSSVAAAAAGDAAAAAAWKRKK